jgi:glycerol kinase
MDSAAHRWEPSMPSAERSAGIARWRQGVARSLDWVTAPDHPA